MHLENDWQARQKRMDYQLIYTLTAESSSPLAKLLNRRLRHSRAPGWVSQLQPVTAWVKEIQFPASEDSLAPVHQPVDGHVMLKK